ncbi:MAG: AAA family ATPase, partial [Succinivibrio sp.]|nr:AAA family ATPase [Succinivibrio sp.]
MSNSLDLQRLPCGETNFERMIDGNLIYVDKTDLIFELTKIESSPILFTRPRRFGKSLLISVLNNLFRQRRQYFKGLKIEKLWQDTRTYKVLHLDFSAIASNDFGKFNRRFTDILKSFAKEYQLTYSEELLNEPRAVLRELLSQCQNGEVVLLIDDYDLPLTSVGGESQSQKAIKECLISFFALLKALSSKFRFMFITGETRSFDMSILSAFNTILDLTLNKKYGALLGFTKEELEHYFLAYIKRAAYELDCTVDEVFYNLKLNYDGFCFEESASVLVYNPWSILNFLQLVSSSC